MKVETFCIAENAICTCCVVHLKMVLFGTFHFFKT